MDTAQAAVAFRAASSNRHSATPAGTTINVAIPTGTISGDVMLASVAVVTNTATVITPTGWTLIQSSNQTGNNTSRLYTYYRVAGTSEPSSYDWTIASADTIGTVAGIASFIGVNTTSPIDASAQQLTGTSTSHQAPSVTTTVAGDMLVTIHEFSSSRTWTPPGGMTEVVDRYSRTGGGGGSGVSLSMHYEPRPTTGATGTRTAVASGNKDRGATHSIALRALIITTIPGDFNIYDTSTTPATAISGLIKTKVSGQTFTLDIAALNTAKTALLTTFTGAVKVEILNGSDSSAVLDVNECRSSWTVIQTLSPNPTFVSANSGRLTVSFIENNAYRDIRIRVIFPAAGTPTKIGCSSDNFSIRPSSFTGLTVRDADSRTAGTSRNLTNTGATGGIVHRAGQPFRIDAVAQNAAGAGITYGTAAGNYGGLPQAQLITCLLPTTACTLGMLDELDTATSWTAGAAAGSFFTTTANYNEAGSFTMNLIDSTFSAVDASDGTPASCAATGQYICSSTTPSVGRFVPDSLELLDASAIDPEVDPLVDTWLPLPAPQLRTFNTTDTTCNTTIASPRRSFTYVGQPFNYINVPRATLKATDATGTPIQNYSGTLMKLTIAGILQTYTTTSGTLDTTLALGTPTLALNANYTNGNDSPVFGSITLNAADRLAFSRAVLIAPFNAAITLNITAQDTSENAVVGNGIITTSLPASFNPIAFDSGAQMRFGRLKLENAHGSGLLNLPIQMETQHWNGTTFTINTADHCTTIVPGNILLNDPQKNLAVNETGITVSGPFFNGKSTNLRLNKPSGGDGVYNGSVNICVDLGIDTPSVGSPPATNIAPVCVATTPANLSWLQGKWSETKYDDDPVIRGTFGVYKNANENIYTREMY